MPREKGFTLIELTVVLVIVGLLFAVAMPNFSVLSESLSYRKFVREVISAAGAAKRSAIKTNQPVDLVFEFDNKRLSVRSAGEQAEQTYSVLFPEPLEISVTGAVDVGSSSDQSVIRFYPMGGSSGGDIELLRPSGVGTLIQVGWLLADIKQRPI